MVVVADTSPLTALLHIQQLHLLHQLYGCIFIPKAVAAELQTLQSFGYDVSFINDKSRYEIRQAADVQLIETLNQYLDAGEAEAIALAKEINADLLLIDEKSGKQYAQEWHIACKGVGVLIEAKANGLILLVKPLPDDLITNLGFRLSDKIYKLALQKAGEPY